MKPEHEPFYLFGAGPRRKLLYRQGELQDARTGERVASWPVIDEHIDPACHRVELTTAASEHFTLFEDEKGVWCSSAGVDKLLAPGPVHLPRFEGHRHADLLRALHHEVLVNIVEGQPLPNLFVYRRPWLRDAAMIAMVLERTGNLALIEPWARQLADPFDRNSGEEEADNPGQALYLASLFGGAGHPVVEPALQALARLESDGHVRGRTDGAEHPVYQTAWAKFALTALMLEDPYTLPEVEDPYAALCWWYPCGPCDEASFSEGEPAERYPYLAWAEAHRRGDDPPLHLLSRRSPLTWERAASQASYDIQQTMLPDLAEARAASPHAWHAAEAFLYLMSCP